MTREHKGFNVSHRSPLKLWVLGLGIIASMTMFFFLGKGYQMYQKEQVRLERDTLRLKVEELESRNSQLVQKNAQLEGSSKVDRDAYELANRKMVELQQQLLVQKEELAFYQGIVSPGGSDLGVNLQSFEIFPELNEGQYSYKLILTKRGRTTTRVRGKVQAVVRGEDGSGLKEHRLTDLKLENRGKEATFSFRYFQVLQGEIQLPANFQPLEVELNIIPTTKKVKSVSEKMPWERIVTEDI